MTKAKLRPAVAPRTATKDKPRKPPAAATKAVPCPTCDGKGKVTVRQQTFEANGDMEEKEVTTPCIRCAGSGKWYE